MKAFHGKQELKDQMIEQIKWHQEQDKIIKGTYGDNGKYCAVGCSLNSLNILQGKELDTSLHKRYESELGIPETLAHLEDGLFENMSDEDAKSFPLRFIESIPVGADLSKVFAEFVVWEWRDKEYGLSNIQEIKDDKEVYDLCENVTSLYERFLRDEKIDSNEWDKLEELADKIYWVRAMDWAWARAKDRAGRAWAWARARVTRVRAMDWAWAWAGAGANFEKQIMISADKLLELLANAPVDK